MNARAPLTALALGLAGVLMVATPAAADPAKPTDYRSEVQDVEPATDAISVEVVGGDGFLHLRVDEGHEVFVEGYQGEPWLHIAADGTVQENIHSSATYVNRDRYARVTEPDIVDPQAAPEWNTIGDGGEHVWHDHRIHWMSPDRPPGRQAGDTVFDDWTVAMTVDAEPVTIHGTLVWVRSENVLPWLAAGVVALVLVLVVARRTSVTVAAAVTTAAAALGVVIGAGQLAATPAAAGGSPLVVVVPVVSFIAGAAALALRRRPVAVVFLLAAVAALAAWAMLRLAVLTHPVLPTDLPSTLDRLGTAAAIGVAIAAAVIAINSGALQPADLDES